MYVLRERRERPACESARSAVREDASRVSLGVGKAGKELSGSERCMSIEGVV